VKLGIPLLVIGTLLLLFCIPYSVMVLLNGFNRLTSGDVSGGFMAYSPLIGVILSFVMITIGASRVFKN
jgi:hypothetical protein